MQIAIRLLNNTEVSKSDVLYRGGYMLKTDSGFRIKKDSVGYLTVGLARLLLHLFYTYNMYVSHSMFKLSFKIIINL